MKFNLEINQDSQSIRSKSFFCKQALGTTASCMISVSSGLTLGISAMMLPQLREDESIHHDPELESWIASISSLAMVLGSLISGPILDSWGRKPAHIILGLPVIIGWIFIACATSTSIVLVGRFITGITAGANRALTMVYIGEITDPKFRAIGLFLPGLMSPLGAMISHVVGYYLGWRISAIVFIVPALLSTVIFIFLKESPLWLIAKGRVDEGSEIFRWFRGTGEAAEKELETVLQRNCEKPVLSARETMKVACSFSFIKPMLILLVAMIDVQVSGMNALSFYSQDVFEKSFNGKIDPFTMTMVMDSIRNLVCLGICVVGGKIPRKLTLLVGNMCEAVFCFGLIACFAVDFSKFVWVPVLCLIMFIIFSSIILSTGWTFVPELLPTNARGLGSSLNATFSFISLFVTVKIIPDIMAAYGEIGLFAYFGVTTFICGVILHFTLPETNGKTLQSIEDSYKKKCVEPNKS